MRLTTCFLAFLLVPALAAPTEKNLFKHGEVADLHQAHKDSGIHPGGHTGSKGKHLTEAHAEELYARGGTLWRPSEARINRPSDFQLDTRLSSNGQKLMDHIRVVPRPPFRPRQPVSTPSTKWASSGRRPDAPRVRRPLALHSSDAERRPAGLKPPSTVRHEIRVGGKGRHPPGTLFGKPGYIRK